MTVHRCPYCRCNAGPDLAHLNINTRAEFWPLVVAVDAAMYPRRMGKDDPTMSGWDWLVVLGLAGVLVLGWLVDEMRAMDRRRIDRAEEAASLRRLRRELRRYD